MHDSWLDATEAPWLHQTGAARAMPADAGGTANRAGIDDPFDPWLYWEIFSGTD